jgi:replicative superfamily II helicase
LLSFREYQEKIFEFITDNYKNYLPSHLNPTYTKEFLDFDKFKNDFTVFIDFARIDFRQSNYEDDCEDIEHCSMTIYLAHRNDKNEVLQNNNLDSAYAFYEMIKDKPNLIIVKDISIESIDFYNYVEGQKYLVVSEISLSLQI